MTKRTTSGRPARADFARRILPIVGAVIVLGSGACRTRTDAKAAASAAAADSVAPEPEPLPEPVAVAPAPAAPEPVEPERRRCDETTLRDDGIGAVVIGDAPDVLRTRCVVFADSTAADPADGRLRGSVVVGVNGAPMTVQVAEGKVYRMTVADPRFRTADGYGPGLPIARMLDLPGAVVLEGEHDLSLVVNAHCGLYFRIPKPAALPANVGRWSDVVRAMPEGTPVERVVVHGCRGLPVL